MKFEVILENFWFITEKILEKVCMLKTVLNIYTRRRASIQNLDRTAST